MTIHTAKIAVSLPASVLESVEAVRKRLGRSRSSVVAEAMETWLRDRTVTAEDARYLEGYAQHPEPEDGSVAVAVMGTWDDWSDASKPKASSASVRARARKGVR